MLQTVLRGLIFVSPFHRNWPVNLPLILPLEAVDSIRSLLEALNFISSGMKITVLNCLSNVVSEYVYFI